MRWRLDRFTFHGKPNTTYSLTELDGSAKTLYSDSEGVTEAASNTVTTDSRGTGYAYIRGDAQLRLSGVVVRDQIRTPLEFDDPTDPNSSGACIRAIDLISAEELAEVQDMTQNPTTDLAPKLQAWFDAALNVYGDGTQGTGGRGARMELDAGNWRISTLQLRPGCSLVGRASRYEVRILQTTDAQAPVIDVLGRADNTDVVQRRTEVFLQNLDINANGNVDALGDPINCINLRAENTSDDPDDPDDLVNRTGVIAWLIQAGGASGYGFYSLKRGRNWIHECQFTGNGMEGTNDCGGIFAQGPDQLFFKSYCGSNYGHQMHIKSSATPMIVEVELGTSKQPQNYASLYMENCTDSVIQGGNCTGVMLFEGQEDDNTANEYDTETRINLSNVLFTFKDKTFTDATDDSVHTLPGFINIKNLRGLNISNCRFKPAADDDIAVHHYTNRPTSIVYIQGARSRAVFNCPLPPLDDWNWPAGAPEQWSGSAPTNTYDSITNKPKQLSVQTTDPTDETHAHLFDRIRGLYDDTLEVDGKVEFGGQLQLTGGTILPPTEMTTAIDISKARNDVTLTGAATWTFSGTPQNGTCCTVTVKATGADRTVTLPASVVDLLTSQTVASFTVKQNAVHHILFEYIFGGWRIGGYPVPDEWVALAASTSYADDTAAAAGGVAIGQRYRNGSAVMVRVA